MWNGSKLANWIFSFESGDCLTLFRTLIVLFTSFYGFHFGISSGILLLTSCLLAFKLPIVIIYFHQLYLGEEILYGPSEKSLTSENFQKPSTPYFLLEGGSIPLEVNCALESFLNGILDKFITKWHSSLAVKDEQFVDEVRHIIKYAIIRIHQTLNLVDFPSLIIDKVIPKILWHLDCFMTGCGKGFHRNIEMFVLESIGENIHPALLSRQEEAKYLKNCSAIILEDILPEQLKSSKLLNILLRDILSDQILRNSLDAVANPDNLNHLIVSFLGENNLVASEIPKLESISYIPILKNFTEDELPKFKEMCVLYPNLQSILKTPPHLYHLMQFLKRMNSLKYLQFCFAVDEFNEKLLNPDIKSEQIERLQVMGQKMFEIYFCSKSPDCIGFGNESIEQMQTIVYSSSSEITRLRTSPILFQAYDHVMDKLEQNFLPRFYRSPEFYQLVTGVSQNSGSSKKRGGATTTGWGKKLRAALRPSWLSSDAKLTGNVSVDPEDDSSYDTGIDLTEVDFIADETDGATDDSSSGVYADLIPVSGRDLTAWITSIPRIISAVDSAGKPIWAFEVEIQRVDIRPEDDPEEYHWTVVRTYLEFYYLESKLVEFHGELGNRLPPKKMFGTRNMQFLESVRLVFEAFLRQLLQQPAFKGSDLIFSFLTLSDLAASQATGESSIMGSNLLSDLGFSRMIRDVPMKLRKERGQDLDNFLQTFVASTETPKPKHSKVESRDPFPSEVSFPVMKELHPLFKDNVKTFLPIKVSSCIAVGRSVHVPLLSGPYDCLIFAAWKIFRIPRLIWALMIGLRSFLRFYFDSYVRNHVNENYRRIFLPEKLKLVLNLLSETVLRPTLSEKKLENQVRHKAWSSIVKKIPDWSRIIFGAQSIEERCEMVFQCFQYPVLNKQLSYILLDILLHECFPKSFG